MTDKCLCESAEVLIFPCSGSSNVGQIANKAALDLTALKKGKMYCLAGIGGHVSAIIESTKAAKKIVVIDGCPVNCARKTLEHAGFKLDVHVVVTKLGITKTAECMMDIDEVNKVEAAVLEQLGGR